MKKLTSYLSLMAVLGVTAVGVNPASALQLREVSTRVAIPPLTGLNTATSVPPDGHPNWYQDQNFVAVELTGIPLTGFPAGFPPEAFYYMATSATVPIANSDVFVLFALESSWIDQTGALVPAGGPAAVTNPALLPLRAITFQRMRMRVRPNAPIPGSGSLLNQFIPGDYTIQHPFGTTIFTCAGPGNNNQSCQQTTDIPAGFAIGADGNIIGGGSAGALGLATPNAGTFTGFDRFLRSTTAVSPFLGDGITEGPIVADPGLARNNVVITDPLGNVATINNFAIIGKTLGVEITPPATGNAFGVVKPGLTGVRKTFAAQNLSGTPLTLTIAANVPASIPVAASTDFSIAASVASATVTPCDPLVPLAIGATCHFDVIFNPVTGEGAKSADILVTSGAPPKQFTVTGISDATLPVLGDPISVIKRFSSTASQTISGTITDNNGVPADGVQVSVDGAAPVAATVNTVAGTWSFVVPALTAQSPTNLAPHTIAVTANDIAQPAPGNLAATVTDTIVFDNTLPVVDITAPVAGPTKVNKPVVTFAVTEQNPAVTTLKVDGTIVATNPVSGTALATALADGARTVRVETTDSAGNIGFKEVALTVDTVVSPFTLTAVTSPTNVLSQTIGGTVEAGATVQVKVGAAAAANATVTGTTWSFPIATLVDGANAISVTATDTLGNTLTRTSNINIVQHDGKIAGAASVTITDALKALQFAAGFTTPTAEEKFRADVAPVVNGVPTGDGNVNVADVMLILRKSAGLPSF